MANHVYSDDLYYDCLATVVWDIYYSNASWDNKIARIRKLTEILVRRLIKYNPDWKLTLGDKRTINALKTAGITEKFFWDAYYLINNDGRESTHSKQTEMPGEKEFSVVKIAALDLYAYLLYRFFVEYPFGQDGAIVKAFSLQPAYLRTMALWQLILNDHSNLYTIDKFVLASVKAFGADGALQIIEGAKDFLLQKDDYYCSDDVMAYSVDPLSYAEKLNELRNNLYNYLHINIVKEGKRFAYIQLPYSNREDAKKFYLEYGILEESTEARKEFNSLMKFMYTGWKTEE